MKKIPSIMKAPGRARLGMAEQARRPLKERPHVVSGYTTFSPYDAFKQKRPPTSVDLILAYRNFVFWCANTVAAAVAAVPHRLYAIQRHGRKAGRFRTKALGRAQMENLRSDHTLAKKLATAAKVEEITEHPYLDLISHVNPWMTTFSLFELMSLYLETVGGSFWSFVRGFGGLPVEIWPLPSWLVYVEPDYSTEKVINRYVFTSGGRQTIFEPSEILYTRRTSLFDPYTQGWSPLRACYEQTEFSDKLIEYDESRLSNMSRPDAVMEATDEGPIGWEETQRINNDFRQNFAMSGAGGLWVAPGGTTLKAMEWPGFDPVAGERAKMTLYGIARAFDIPAAMVDSTGTSRANLDATLLEFSRRAVMPRCRRIEEEINSNLMPLYSDDIFIAFDTAVPADKVLERETHAAYISAGVMSRNEARLELGLAPVDGGDELLVSNSLVPLSRAIDPPAPVIPGRVQGAEPDEVPTEATTPESSEREEPADEADDGEFAEGEDMEASTDEPEEKALDPDAAGAIPDAAVAKALRVIDLIHERLAAEGEDEREDGRRLFRRAIGKHNPCHGAHDGRFCHTPGGGGGAPAHAPAGALGVDVTSGAEHGVTKLRRQVADRAEATIAAALGGHRLKDYEAMDVRIPKADGSGHHVVEVKTMQHGSKTGISVHENAWVRKIDHASKNPGDTFHTVVIDLRHSTEGGAHAGKYSGHELYYKRTSGPFGLASMHKVADMAELGRLIGSPAARLPADARGQFPRGAELRALRERAAKERAYNNERSRERKRRLGAIAYGRTPRDQGSNATASSG